MNQPAMITLSDVGKSYDGGRTEVVRGIDLEVRSGEMMVLLGESGCGKTTTLKLINRLIDLTRGRITVAGRDITGVDPVALRREIGYVFQGIGLFPHMTIAENVAAVPHLLGWEKRAIATRVDELLHLVGLPPGIFRSRRPRELSGGQRQRVGVARALAARPQVLLMDEPFGALDPITRDGLQAEFVQLQRHLKLTVVMVTHDMTEALLLADRLAVMDDGRIVGLGTPHELLTAPPHPQVAALLETPQRQADRLKDLARPDEAV